MPGRAPGRGERGILGAARATRRVPSHRCYVPRMTGRARPSRRRPRRVLRWVLLGVAALVLAAAALLARDVVAARDAFAAVVDDLPDAEDALLDGDLDSYDALVERIQHQAHVARTSTDGPLWWLAARLPWVGANAAALTSVGQVVDDLATSALPPLRDVGGVLADGGLRVVDSTIDLQPLRDAQVPLTQAYDAVADAEERLLALDPDALVAQLSDPLAGATQRVSELRSAIEAGHDITTLLPPMLGGDGPRTYLVLAQNNAELRSTGGIAGAVLVVTADDGRITMEEVAPARVLGTFDEESLLDPAQREVYGDNPGRFVMDVTMVPQFPQAARTVAQMWDLARGQEVDGVLAVDPVALSFLLEQVGPVETAAGTLGADDVVEVLLSDVYRDHTDPDASDAVFAETAAAVMERVLGGGTDGAALVEAVRSAVDERRLLVWSAHEEEQAILGPGAMGGDLDAAPDAVGIFLNDGTRGKVGYYLDVSVELVDSQCVPEGRRDTVRLTLASTLSPDLVEALPSYVTGTYLPPEQLGTIRTNVAFYGAVDGRVELARDGVVVGATRHEVAGRVVTVLTQDLAPGESVTFDLAVVGADADDVREVWTTPTSRTPGTYELDAATCAAP